MLGHSRIRRVNFYVLGMVLPFAFSASVSHANIDLVFSPAAITTSVGETIEIELRAVADSMTPERFSTVEALIIWDPSSLQLLQSNPAVCGGTPFFVCGFLPNPDDINDGSGSPNLPDNDGDAFHTSISNPNPSVRPEAPPAPGFLVTTFRFMVLPGAVDTQVFVQDNFPGGISTTRVLEVNNVNVTGTIDDAFTTITLCDAGPDSDGDGVPDGCDICPGENDILDADEDGIPDGCDPCPLVETPGIVQGDLDEDLTVTLSDTPGFVDVLLGLDTDADKVAASDVNCDGNADGLDINGFIQLLL